MKLNKSILIISVISIIVITIVFGLITKTRWDKRYKNLQVSFKEYRSNQVDKYNNIVDSLQIQYQYIQEENKRLREQDSILMVEIKNDSTIIVYEDKYKQVYNLPINRVIVELDSIFSIEGVN